jgi:hypothetical protein
MSVAFLTSDILSVHQEHWQGSNSITVRARHLTVITVKTTVT